MPRPFHLLDFRPDKECKYLNIQNCKIYAFSCVVKHVCHTEKGDCRFIKKTIIYTKDTIEAIDIRRHKAKQNIYKHDLQTPPSTWRIRDKNADSVPSSKKS